MEGIVVLYVRGLHKSINISGLAGLSARDGQMGVRRLGDGAGVNCQEPLTILGLWDQTPRIFQRVDQEGTHLIIVICLSEPLGIPGPRPSAFYCINPWQGQPGLDKPWQEPAAL